MTSYIIDQGKVLASGYNVWDFYCDKLELIERSIFTIIDFDRKIEAVYSYDFGTVIFLDENKNLEIYYVVEDSYGVTGFQKFTTENLGLKCASVAFFITDIIIVDEFGKLWKIIIEDLVPKKISISTDAKFVSVTGKDHILALDDNGQIWSWVSKDVGPKLLTLGQKFVKLVAGHFHSLAIDIDGRLWSYGTNREGSLGLGDNIDRDIFTLVPFDKKVVDISANFSHTVIIDENGAIWSCGDNEYYQLGLGDNINRNVLTLSCSKNNYVSVSAFHVSTLALDTNGDLWVCGNNDSGELGLNCEHTYFDRFTKVPNIKATKLMNCHTTNN